MNTANILTAIIPTIAVLLGILLNRQETLAIRSEMSHLRSEMFQLRDSIHRDMIGLHERLATVEAKQAS